jgi:hypothetical protein
VTVTWGGRTWRELVASRTLRDASGKPHAFRQEIYVTTGDSWGIGVTISATPEQFTEYRAAFDAILQTARLTANSTL